MSMRDNKPATTARGERHPEYRKAPLTRRQFAGRVLTVAGIGAAGGYLALAPEHWPGSLQDATGLRGVDHPEPFRLPDFRVAPPAGKPAVGIGRTGPANDNTVGQRLSKALDALGGLAHYIQPGDVVLIKPNVAFDRSPNLGATTHPAVLEALIHQLRALRVAEIRVADNPIESPADCFLKSGIRPAAEKAGARVFLPDGNAFRMLDTPGATLIERWWFFERPFRGVTKVIGLSPVKDHNLCSASMGIKNWYGLLGGRRNQFHQRIHDIVSDLSIMIRPTLTVLDGTHVLMENGPTGGDPSNVKAGDAVLAGTDPVALDAWAFEHLLERRQPPRYLELAEAKGSGRRDYRGRVEEIVG